MENDHFAFLSPFGGLGSTYAVLFKAHWKASSGLAISDNWTFSARCYGWGATSEYRDWKSAFLSNGVNLAQNFRYSGPSPPTILLGGKLLSYGIKYGQKFLSFCNNSRVWRTDGQTFFSWLILPYTVCSTVKKSGQLSWVCRNASRCDYDRPCGLAYYM